MIPVHVPVMLNEVLDRLAPSTKDAFIVDGTLGEAGHASAFLESFPNCRILGIDADATMRGRAAQRLAPWEGRWEIRPGWTDEVLEDWAGPAPDRILVDLGISVFHYEGSGRGFSFQGDEVLDMRLDTDEGESVADMVATLPETELADLIYGFGEERFSRRIARGIVEARKDSPIETAAALADVIRRSIPPQARRGRLHPATRTFQALRIAANRELEHLDRFLEIAPGLLAPQGRLGVISFHSLEDRRVKRAFRGLADRENPEYRLIGRKPLMPTEEECRTNPPSRSAKFRVLERIGDAQ